MKRLPSFRQRRARTAVLVAALHALLPFASGAGIASAAEARPVTALDCWIASDRSVVITEYIRCIRDRSHDFAEPEPVGSATEVALDHMHRLLHDGSIDLLDLYATNALPTVGPDEVVTIRIFSYPSPWSWDEQRPQQLVRAVLCPDGHACPVYFRRDFPAATPLTGLSHPIAASASRRNRRHD